MTNNMDKYSQGMDRMNPYWNVRPDRNVNIPIQEEYCGKGGSNLCNIAKLMR